jgi:selenocysteine lyase/cysteine desulfurase
VNAAGFRSRFPALGRSTHLASCSLGARSADLDEAVHRMLDDMAAGGAPWGLFEEQVFEARQRFAALIGAQPCQVAAVPNASVGAYQVASTTDWSVRPKIVTTALEFPSVAHVWLAQRPRGAEVEYAERYEELVDGRTGLVSVPMTTYQDARRMPVADVARLAHDAGAKVFVDAYQAVGTEPVDVERLGCDYLVAGTMKYLLGLPGMAFLYVRDPESVHREPSLTGWFGRTDPFAFDPRTLDFAATAARFETGTPAVPAAYTANAGLRLIGELDLAEVRRHVLDLQDHAIERLTAQGEVLRVLPRDDRGAHIGLLDPAPPELARSLARHGIAVSPRGDVVRLSFHYYTDASDVAALCAALAEVRDLHLDRTDHESSGRIHVHS